MRKNSNYKYFGHMMYASIVPKNICDIMIVSTSREPDRFDVLLSDVIGVTLSL